MRICSIPQSVHDTSLDQELFVWRKDATHFPRARVHLHQRFSSPPHGQRHRKDSSTCSTTRQTHHSRHPVSGSQACHPLFFIGKVGVCLWVITLFHHGTRRFHPSCITENTKTSVSHHGQSQFFLRRDFSYIDTHQEHPIWQEKVAHSFITHQFFALPSGSLLSIHC